MGDSYRPEYTSRRDGDTREREWDRRRDEEWRAERNLQQEAREKSRRENSRSRKYADQAKFEGKPPPNYICNRCHVPGHHLQACPTNLDPSYDRAPDEYYTCEICHKSGHHFKSLCPQNTDPYSIIQKRRARGIATQLTRGSSQCNEFDRESRLQQERVCERRQRRADGRLTTYSSSSSARNTPASDKKKELVAKVQEIEDRKQRLFREESNDIGEMKQASTTQQSSGKKRDKEATSIDSPTSNTIQAKKKLRREGDSLYPVTAETYECFHIPRRRHSQILEGLKEGNDTQMQGYADHDSAQSQNYTRSSGCYLRPIGEATGSMISDYESSDDMEIAELVPEPQKDYSSFVQNLIRKHLKLTEVVNFVKKRKTAQEMWEKADRMRRKQPKTRSSSEREYGRLTPVTVEAMTIQLDGACDDITYVGYYPSEVQKMTFAQKDHFLDNHQNSTTALPTVQPTNTSELRKHVMTSTNEDSIMKVAAEGPMTPKSSKKVMRELSTKEADNDSDASHAFRGFAAQQRRNADAVQRSRAQNTSKRFEITKDLRDFSVKIKLSAPLPHDVAPESRNPEVQKKENSESDVVDAGR